MYCNNCGSRTDDSSTFCVSCGAPIDNPGQANMNQNYANTNQNYANVNPEAKSKLVAGLLQILLPGLAIGRFYLGYTNIAILQIVASVLTCGIGTLWPIIDGIMILTGSVPTDANGVPLKD